MSENLNLPSRVFTGVLLHQNKTVVGGNVVGVGAKTTSVDNNNQHDHFGWNHERISSNHNITAAVTSIGGGSGVIVTTPPQLNNNRATTISNGKDVLVIKKELTSTISNIATNQENVILDGKYTFHTAVIHQEKKKRKKKELLEGCNHFKISNSSSYGTEEVIVEMKRKKKKVDEKSTQVQVSNFDVLATTNTNAMFGVFKKKPSQQAYETVLMFSNSDDSKHHSFLNSQSIEHPISLNAPSPIDNPSSNSTSNPSVKNPSPQPPFLSNSITTTGVINTNTCNLLYSNGSCYPQIQHHKQQYHPQNPNHSSPTGIMQPPSMRSNPDSNNGFSKDNTTLQPIGLSNNQPTRDFSTSYGTLTRSAHFQSATDMLFFEKQNTEQENLNETVNSNQNKEIMKLPSIIDLSYPPNNFETSLHYNNNNSNPSISSIPTQQLGKSSNNRFTIPSIKELLQ